GYMASDFLELRCGGTSGGDGELGRILEGLVAGFPGDVGVAVLDLQTGEEVHIDGDRPHKSASSIKLFMISAALKQIDQGLAPGSVAAIQHHIDETGQVSTDHPTGEILRLMGDGSQQRGGELVNEHMAELGMTNSRLVQWFDFHDPGFVEDTDHVHFNNRFTALDVVRAIRSIREGRTYARALATEQLVRLHQLNGFYYLRRDLPLHRLFVADKVGFIAPES